MAPSTLRDDTKVILIGLLRRLIGPYLLPGALAMTLVTAAAWIGRYGLNSFVRQHPAAIMGAFVGLLAAWLVLAGSLWIGCAALGRGWLSRTAQLSGISRLAQPSAAERLIGRLPDPLEVPVAPSLRKK